MEPRQAETVAAPTAPVAAERAPEPAVAQTGAAEQGESEVESLPIDLGIISESEAEAELGLEEPVDYDSMKNRIESTRSRLKAKAFDAMMTGESALLGRDLEGVASSKARSPAWITTSTRPSRPACARKKSRP